MGLAGQRGVGHVAARATQQIVVFDANGGLVGGGLVHVG